VSGGEVIGVPFRFLAREVDERVGAQQLPLLAVTIHAGVVRRDTLTEDLPRAEDLSNYKRCQRGDIVLNRMRAFQGALGVAPEEGIVSPDYAVLRTRDDVNPRFIAHVLASPWGVSEMAARLRGIGGTANGAVRTPRINVRDLGSI
jgi:type I restriction enzyme S subunit